MPSTSASKRFTSISWVLVAAWACFIFFASAHTADNFENPTDWLGQLKQWLDGVLAQWNIPGLKESSSLGHFVEFSVFGALLANAFHCHMDWRKACVLAVVCASAYGATDEFHQLFVPGRACDPVDWVVDTCGGALGATLRWLARRR
ncbi:MAG: VanZ family protein [Coriobacteriia bacterium]|nr:VanZ family protein [Coriobacteriia bacterium]